ncbi:hypothetical protein WQ54_01450 [Bacillus sp. SA1-12]|uniref:DUF3397 domain-containing protein n=1 Tax=Bacillus sp. SA1-12 TaxID=1455638 RepID=UPI000624FC6D|nr:DUF3397 domain-containing protein [Bacillus sp. SA1-12]KKI93747.1 hypothetical protein WQ54_01450 [Bacillus sp. SA1-12]
MDFIIWIISFAFALPIVCFVFLLFVSRLMVKNKKKSILLTFDLSTIFFIMSVHFLLLTLFGRSFLFYIIVGILCLSLFVYYMDNKRAQPSFTRVSKKVWRLSFLFFFVSYIILTLFGIAAGMIQNVFTPS